MLLPSATEVAERFGQTPPRQMAIAVDGTHPTGMHSCFEFNCYFFKFENFASTINGFLFENYLFT